MRTKEALKQLQALSLDVKILMTKKRIKQWYDYWSGNVYISFSGGKDSTVLLHLVRSLYPDVPAVFVNTGLEYPEVVRHVQTFDNVEMLRPEMNFKQVVSKYGYPVHSKIISRYVHDLRYAKLTPQRIEMFTTGFFVDKNGEKRKSRFKVPEKLINAPFEIGNKCCDIMKKHPFKLYEKKTGRKPFLGTMADESFLREQTWIKNGCNAFDSNHPQSTPLSFWTEQDIYHYIVKNGFKIPSVYGDIVPADPQIEMFADNSSLENTELKTTGVDRTGCMFCVYGAQAKGDERFLKMKDTHPKIYEWCMKPVENGGLGLDSVLSYLGIKH